MTTNTTEKTDKEKTIEQKEALVHDATAYYTRHLRINGIIRTLFESLRSNPAIVEFITENEPWELLSPMVIEEIYLSYLWSHKHDNYSTYLQPELHNILSDVYDEGTRFAYMQGYDAADGEARNKIAELEEKIRKLEGVEK